MKIAFTQHAKKRIQQRNIDRAKITKSLQNPDILTIEDEKENIYSAYKHTNKHSIKVVYVERDNEKRIITVFKTTKRRAERVKNILIEGGNL